MTSSVNIFNMGLPLSHIRAGHTEKQGKFPKALGKINHISEKPTLQRKSH